MKKLFVIAALLCVFLSSCTGKTTAEKTTSINSNINIGSKPATTSDPAEVDNTVKIKAEPITVASMASSSSITSSILFDYKIACNQGMMKNFKISGTVDEIGETKKESYRITQNFILLADGKDDQPCYVEAVWFLDEGEKEVKKGDKITFIGCHPDGNNLAYFNIEGFRFALPYVEKATESDEDKKYTPPIKVPQFDYDAHGLSH